MTRRTTLSERGFSLPSNRDAVTLWRAIRDFLRPDFRSQDIWVFSNAAAGAHVINAAAARDGFTYSANYLRHTSTGMSAAIWEVRVNPDARDVVSAWIGQPAKQIWPGMFRKPAATSAPDVSTILAGANAFRVAIDALPVGRDIRARLNVHIDAHIAAIDALGGQA